MSFKRVSLWFSSLVKVEVEKKILSSLDLQTMAWKEAISSIMTKVEMAKDIHFQIEKRCRLQMWKCFATWIRQMQSNQIVAYRLAGL